MRAVDRRLGYKTRVRTQNPLLELVKRAAFILSPGLLFGQKSPQQANHMGHESVTRENGEILSVNGSMSQLLRKKKIKALILGLLYD